MKKDNKAYIESLGLEDVKDIKELYGTWCNTLGTLDFRKEAGIKKEDRDFPDDLYQQPLCGISFREDGKFYCECDGNFGFRGNFSLDGDTVVLKISKSAQWLSEEGEKILSYKVKKRFFFLVLVSEDNTKFLGPFKKSQDNSLQKSLAQLINDDDNFSPISYRECDEEDACYFDIEDYLEQISDFDGGVEGLTGLWSISEILFLPLVPKEEFGADIVLFYIKEALKKKAFHFKEDATCYYCNIGEEHVLKGIYSLEGNVVEFKVKQVAKWEKGTPKERFKYIECTGQKKLTLKVDEKNELLVAVEQDEKCLVAYFLERNDEPVASYMVFNFVEDFEGTPDDLVGQWKTTKVMSDYHLPKEDVKEGMIDAMEIEIYNREYHFNPDGSVVFKTGNGTVLFGQYELDETELTLNVSPAGSQDQEQTFRYQLMQEDCNIVFVEQSQNYIIYAVLSKEAEEDGESGENRQKKDQRYEYEGACSAPRLYAAEVLHAELISDSGALNANFGNSSHAEGMGNGHQCIVRNDDGKYYLPKGMEAVWVSLVERKVYSVATLLPYNQILKLFRANESLNMIDICLLPGGKFAIYLHGGGDAVMLDNPSYIAPVEEDEEALEYICHSNNCDNMDEYFDRMCKYAREDKSDWICYLSKKGSPAPILDKYIQRFNYDFDFEFEDNSATLVSTRSLYLNNERFSETFQHIDKEIHKAMVKFVLANWDDETSRYTCYLYFNEEVLQAFEEAYGGDPKQKGKLKIKVAKDFQSYELSLNVGDKSVPLNKTEIRVFARPLSDLDQDGKLVYINYEKRQNYFLDDSEYFEK